MILRKNPNGVGFQGPIDEHDWRWFNDAVSEKLKKLHDEGFGITIFTNQGSIQKAMLGANSTKIRRLINNVLQDLDKKNGCHVPVQVVMATGRDPCNFRKPRTGMWDFFVDNLNAGVAPDLEQSFYVGDAAGRADDINNGSDSDKQFAASVGIKFHLPEEFFGCGISPTHCFVRKKQRRVEKANPSCSADISSFKLWPYSSIKNRNNRFAICHSISKVSSLNALLFYYSSYFLSRISRGRGIKDLCKVYSGGHWGLSPSTRFFINIFEFLCYCFLIVVSAFFLSVPYVACREKQETTCAEPSNAGLAASFSKMGKLLQDVKKDFMRGRAFLNVSIIITDWPTKITSSKDLKGVKGVGKSSMAKIDEFLATGKMEALEELKSLDPKAVNKVEMDKMAAAFL